MMTYFVVQSIGGGISYVFPGRWGEMKLTEAVVQITLGTRCRGRRGARHARRYRPFRFVPVRHRRRSGAGRNAFDRCRVLHLPACTDRAGQVCGKVRRHADGGAAGVLQPRSGYDSRRPLDCLLGRAVFYLHRALIRERRGGMDRSRYLHGPGAALKIYSGTSGAGGIDLHPL